MIARSFGIGIAAWLMTASAAAQQPGAPPGTMTQMEQMPGAPPPGNAQPPPPQQPLPPPPQPQPEPLPSAGGLTAPGAIPDNQRGKKGETQEKLDKSHEKDSGRGLSWFWIDVEGGFQHVGLETFAVDKSNLTAGLAPTSSSGGYIGAGLGVQLFFVRLGPRGRIGFFKDWQLFSIGGELGFVIPLGFLEPHIELGGGYVAAKPKDPSVPSEVLPAALRGGYGRIGGGLDFYIGKVFSFGPAAYWEFMGLTRPGVSLADLNPSTATSLDDAQKKAVAAEGSGYGSAISIGGQVGLSF